MWIIWTQSRSHLRFINCVAAYVNMDCQSGNWRRVSQSLYCFKWLMHSLTTLCTHYAPICAHKLINFHESLLQNVNHMKSIKRPSQINNLCSSICKYKLPNRELKEGFTKFLFFKWLMHSLTTLCTHYAPICAHKLINFQQSLLQNVNHMNSIKKPPQINNMWSSICKYGMPNRELKEGFTKFVFFQIANVLINNIMHPCILHLYLRIYWLTFT